MGRKVVFSLSCLALFIGLMTLFRQQIAVATCRLLLTQTLGKECACQQLSTADGAIAVDGFSFKRDQMSVEIARAVFSLNYKQLLLHPGTWLQLSRGKGVHWSSCLGALQQYGLTVDIEKGVLTLDDARYTFAFKTGEESHKIGTLHVGGAPHCDPPPFLIAEFHMRGDQLISQVKIGEIASGDLFPLAAFAFPQYLAGCCDASGSIQMDASVIVEKDGQIDEISTRFCAQHLALSIPQFHARVGASALKGEFNYPEEIDDPGIPIWKRAQGILKLASGWVEMGDGVRLSRLTGEVVFDPRQNPALDINGAIESGETTLGMKLVGSRGVDVGQDTWLACDLKLADGQGICCDSAVSICRFHRDSHLIQFEVADLVAAQVEMLKGCLTHAWPAIGEWRVLEGSFSGRLLALVESGMLASFEVQGVSGENVSLACGQTPFSFSHITACGRLSEELHIGCGMPLSHFAGFLFGPIRPLYEKHHRGEMVELTSTIAFSGDRVTTSATVAFPKIDQTIDFGFTSSAMFPNLLDEIREGWMRSDKVTEELYGPIVQMVAEDLNVYGEIDLMGSYDGQTLDCLLQVDHLLTKHPMFDLKAEQVGEKGQIKGRIRLSYHPRTGAFSLNLPLICAQGYERSYGILVQDLDAHLFVDAHKVDAQVSKGRLLFDGQPFAHEVQGSLLIDDQSMAIRDARAQLLLNTDRQFSLCIDEWTPRLWRAKLLDGDAPMASCELTKGGLWSGQLHLQPLDRQLEIAYSRSPETGEHMCTARGDIYLSVRKRGHVVHLDALEAFGVDGKGSLLIEGDQYQIQSLTLNKGDLRLDVLGQVRWELPSTSSPFAIQSLLELSAVFDRGIPICFASEAPFHLGFSYPMGCVISDMAFSCSDSRLACGQLEYLIGQKQASICGGSFSLASDLLFDLVKIGVLPEMVHDLSFFKKVEGTFSSSHTASSHTVTAALARQTRPLIAHCDWQPGSMSMTFGQEGTLTASLRQGPDRKYFLKSLRGRCEDVHADLIAIETGQLKGTLTFGLSAISHWIGGPLTDYLRQCEAEGRVSLTGVFDPSAHLRDWTFKGKVRGRDMQWKGYLIDAIESKMEITPKRIAIENGDITDEAGKAWIAEGSFELSDHTWNFSFPVVEIRSFQPSFVRRTKGIHRGIHPLVVKSSTLTDMQGQVGNLESITASGKLRFTNISHKGESALPRNLPTQALAAIGLDGALFVPTSGKLEYLIQEGCIYLKGVEDMISWQGRSQFAPPGSAEMGYVGFDGRIFLDMHIYQNVVPTLSGPIDMAVRGSIADPIITIR